LTHKTEIKLASEIDPKTGTGSGTYAYTSGAMLLIILQELFLVRQVLLQQMQVDGTIFEIAAGQSLWLLAVALNR
jgi:hypothetical protein